MKRITIVLCAAALCVFAVLAMGLSRPASGRQFSFKVGTNLLTIVAGTNVSSITPGVTRGYSKAFYWPNRLSWAADQVCQSMPFLKLSIPSGREVARAEGTVVWLQCNHPTKRLDPRDVFVWHMNNWGQKGIPPGGFTCQIAGGRTIIHFILSSDVAIHRGAIFHVEDRSTGEDLTTVQIH